MSQYVYAVLPYDSGIFFDPDEHYNCVFDYKIYELKDISKDLIYPDMAEYVTMFKDFIVFNTCLRVSNFCGNPKNGFNSLRKDFYLIEKRIGLKEVLYVTFYFTDYMDAPGYSYEKFLEDMKGKYKDYVSELCIDVLIGKEYHEFYHDDFKDIVL
ncbi:MAG: hypothetical protein Q4E68_01105 [Prevotellaceae bacterium]|nr:hypothetical protein [Prevotellaceae bacterium]